MANKARNYSDQTYKILFALSGNQCAFPGCNRRMVNTQNAKDSNICHIEAASEGGERYNPQMSDKERADFPNLILLCVQHHDETNDVEKFTASILREMKQAHESNALNEAIIKNPSMLSNAISALSSIDLEDLKEQESLSAFSPGAKIMHNAIKRNASLIHEYKVHYHKINSLYDELEAQGSIRKGRLLDNIKIIYTQVKGRYVLDSLNELEIIKLNSDNIIDEVYHELYLKMESSSYWEEDIALGIQLIMVDAFMRCKILEEPPKSDS